MTKLEKKAFEFAKKAHEGIIRKFSGQPYFDEHVLKVYETVKDDDGDESERCAALLHDTVEDVEPITHEILEAEFGKEISNIVRELTSDDKKLEEMGKGPYLLDKMSHMSDKALNVKLRDRWCNIQDLPTASPKFKKKYYDETRFIMNGITKRDLTPKHIKIINEINSFLDNISESVKYIKSFTDFKK